MRLLRRPNVLGMLLFPKCVRAEGCEDWREMAIPKETADLEMANILTIYIRQTR